MFITNNDAWIHLQREEKYQKVSKYHGYGCNQFLVQDKLSFQAIPISMLFLLVIIITVVIIVSVTNTFIIIIFNISILVLS